MGCADASIPLRALAVMDEGSTLTRLKGCRFFAAPRQHVADRVFVGEGCGKQLALTPVSRVSGCLVADCGEGLKKPSREGSCGGGRVISRGGGMFVLLCTTRFTSIAARVLNSQLQHYAPIPGAATSPPSLHRMSNNIQNTTSAWDDWDSDGEEKVRLVGYWKRSGKDKSTAHASTSNIKGKERERERADSKISYSSNEERRSHEKQEKKSKNSLDRKSEKKQSKESSRSQSRTSRYDDAKTTSSERESYKKHKKRPSGFIRALSCGC